MATMQHKIFCVREFIKTEPATAVHRAFRLRFNIQPPTRKSICRWNHQFEQIGCLCKGKSSGRPRVSEENVRRIQESFERSPRKSTRRASREILNTATNYLACVEAPFTVQAISYLSIVLIFKYRLTKLSLFFFNHAVFQNHRHHNYKIIRGNYRKLENKNIGCC